MNTENLVEYYARRAHEYELIYSKPERQKDLSELRQHLQDLVRGHNVLELACGTGYWTHVISSVVNSVLATDINSDMLSIAEQKQYPEGRVRFLKLDMKDVTSIEGNFSAAISAFWLSHLKKNELPTFLSNLHSKLGTGKKVIFIDNVYVEGSSTPIASRDSEGNTYQYRNLKNDTRYLVLKNYPNVEEIRSVIGTSGEDLEIKLFTYYWCASYYISAGF